MKRRTWIQLLNVAAMIYFPCILSVGLFVSPEQRLLYVVVVMLCGIAGALVLWLMYKKDANDKA